MYMTAKNTPRLNTTQLVYTALGAVLIAICSWINIPTVIPFTMQTFAVFSILLLLGGQNGTLSIIIYIIMGAIGIPVFHGFTGGVGILLGPTGGYIIGFVISGLVYMLTEKAGSGKMSISIISLITGLVLCYSFGTIWFITVYTRQTGPMGLGTALTICVFPYIIPDLIKLALAVILTTRIKKYNLLFSYPSDPD